MCGERGAGNAGSNGNLSGCHDAAGFKVEMASAQRRVIGELGDDVRSQVWNGCGSSGVQLNVCNSRVELSWEGHFGALPNELLRILCFHGPDKLIAEVIAEADGGSAGVVQADVGLSVFTDGDGKIRRSR